MRTVGKQPYPGVFYPHLHRTGGVRWECENDLSGIWDIWRQRWDTPTGSPGSERGHLPLMGGLELVNFLVRKDPGKAFVLKAPSRFCLDFWVHHTKRSAIGFSVNHPGSPASRTSRAMPPSPARDKTTSPRSSSFILRPVDDAGADSAECRRSGLSGEADQPFLKRAASSEPAVALPAL